jgi:hypothetical protein
MARQSGWERRGNQDEKRRPCRIMVAPNPDRCKPLVTVPRAAISPVMPFFCLSPGPTASAYGLGVTSACWGAAAGIVQCRETLVSANSGLFAVVDRRG